MQDDSVVIHASSTGPEVIGFDLLTPLLRFVFGSDGLFAGFTLAEASDFFAVFWTVFVIVSYVLSAIMLFLYVYAAMQWDELDEHEMHHIHAAEEAFARQRQGGVSPNRFAEMKEHINSDNPNDWKLAIIEADIMLDEALKRQGYAGTTLGERLRSISPQSLRSLDDAWQAHKVRNDIAHSGVDFTLTQRLAQETIVQFERVFDELGLLSGNAPVQGGGHH